MKRCLILLLLGALALTGCMRWFPPPDPDPEPPPALTITATPTVNGNCVDVIGCVAGGTPPYGLIYECNAKQCCVPAGCPACPQTGNSDECCFEFTCCYDDLGTYTIVIAAQDSKGLIASKVLEVTISAPPVTIYTITATAGQGGSISPSGTVSVRKGENQTFTIRVFSGHTLGDVLVDGVSVLDQLINIGPNVWAYTFENVQANHTIQALFGMELPPGPPPDL